MELSQEKIEKITAEARVKADKIAAQAEGDWPEKIKNAFEFSYKIHKDQVRKSGKPYIYHTTAVAERLWKKYKDPELAIAGFLHDAIEDEESLEAQHVYEEFGPVIGFMCDAMNKRDLGFHEYLNKKFKDKTIRLIWAGLKDVRVLLLKIADREHNLKTIGNLSEEKQVRMAFETQAIFWPLKDILSYDKPLSIEKTTELFKKFIKKHKLNSPLKIKQYLYDKTFDNFDERSFGLVYRNSSKVIWRVDGMEMYKKLLSLQSLKNKIEFVSAKSNGKWLSAELIFARGTLINKNIKLKISSFGMN